MFSRQLIALYLICWIWGLQFWQGSVSPEMFVWLHLINSVIVNWTGAGNFGDAQCLFLAVINVYHQDFSIVFCVYLDIYLVVVYFFRNEVKADPRPLVCSGEISISLFSVKKWRSKLVGIFGFYGIDIILTVTNSIWVICIKIEVTKIIQKLSISMKLRHSIIKIIGIGFSPWRVSVSRAIKPFGEPDRPPEWFSQKVRNIFKISPTLISYLYWIWEKFTIANVFVSC